jgi:hypothetical protein
MSIKKKQIWIGSAFLIVLLFSHFYRIPVVEIAGDHSSFFIKDDQFVLGWIHSIEKEEWFESYQREGQKIILTETHFKTFGAGTPYQAKETTTKNGFIAMEMHIDYEELNITTSEHVQTTLFFSDREVPLHHYFDQYESVIVRTLHLPVWEYIRGDSL